MTERNHDGGTTQAGATGRSCPAQADDRAGGVGDDDDRGLPLDTVWNVYGAMIEAADQEDPEAHAGTPVVPHGPDIHKVTRMTPEQCRQARALIDWSKLDLARASGIMARTIGLWERGKHPSVEPMVSLMRSALEEVGIAFSVDGSRVWLRQSLERGSVP